jgi:malate dehydrogenase
MSEEVYPWPVGVYVDRGEFSKIMMAMETQIGPEGVTYQIPDGTPEELRALSESYGHLCKLRDEVIQMGILPPCDQWSQVNSHL